MNLLQTFLDQKHTSGSAIILALFVIASVWVPEKYQQKLEKTEHALIAYGLLAAADATRKNGNGNGNNGNH